MAHIQLTYECLEGKDNVYNSDQTYQCTADRVNHHPINLQICSGKWVVHRTFKFFVIFWEFQTPVASLFHIYMTIPLAPYFYSFVSLIPSIFRHKLL